MSYAKQIFRVGLLGVSVVIASIGSSANAEEASKVDGSGQKVVVHLSHFTDDLHRCFMAVKVANLMQDYDAEVTLFVDLEGVRIAERKQELKFNWGPDSPTLAELYEKFAAGGGKVLVCPHCAKSAHVTDPGLKRNAQIATLPMLGKMLIEADKVMDY
ncbi:MULTISPECIES: DsrE family protein [Rhodopirellula]|uniref:DsrE family protein n=1 Tax=Rhodopirellula TaxID=265488 RepID=UPI00258077E4|nr:DsrE family protein [Rhodopirellula sp. UBA1907]|tara:strand:+ start:658 stop:1131 length:474 start_codon:yes stop_codon:yes gene_type:complete